LKTNYGGSGNDIAQSRVIEHHLRDNPIYGRHEPPPAQTHVDHCNNSAHHQHQHHQHHRHHPAAGSAAAPAAGGAHSYEKLDHVIINPTSSSANPAYNLLTVATPTAAAAAVTSPDVVNTMGYLVASPPSCGVDARPIIIWAPRSRDVAAVDGNMAELSVVTAAAGGAGGGDQHGGGGRGAGAPCCCTSASGLPSTATTSGGGGYMECDNSATTRARNAAAAAAAAIGGDESRERHHVTGGAESRAQDSHHWFPARDQNAASHRCAAVRAGQYTSMTHRHDRLNDWNISAL